MLAWKENSCEGTFFSYLTEACHLFWWHWLECMLFTLHTFVYIATCFNVTLKADSLAESHRVFDKTSFEFDRSAAKDLPPAWVVLSDLSLCIVMQNSVWSSSSLSCWPCQSCCSQWPHTCCTNDHSDSLYLLTAGLDKSLLKYPRLIWSVMQICNMSEKEVVGLPMILFGKRGDCYFAKTSLSSAFRVYSGQHARGLDTSLYNTLVLDVRYFKKIKEMKNPDFPIESSHSNYEIFALWR